MYVRADVFAVGVYDRRLLHSPLCGDGANGYGVCADVFVKSLFVCSFCSVADSYDPFHVAMFAVFADGFNGYFPIGGGVDGRNGRNGTGVGRTSMGRCVLLLHDFDDCCDYLQ